MERSRPHVFEIAAISLAVMLLEINYTRIISFKFYYYFTYFIIGISLLGLGAGGVCVALSGRVRGARSASLIAICSATASASVLLGYLAIALTEVHTTEITRRLPELIKLSLLTGALFVPFFASGIAISTILGARPDVAGRLYGADLLGAAVGCTLSVPLMILISPPSAVMLGGTVFALAAWRARGWHSRRFAAWPVLMGLYLGVALTPGALPDVQTGPDKTMYTWKRESRTGLILGTPPGIVEETWFSKWSPVFRVDVTRSRQSSESLLLHHDGHIGSALYRFDGDVSELTRFDGNSRALPFAVLGESPRVLIIGSAGGNEILASLYFGSDHITAVELNPVTVSLLTDVFASVTGNLAEHERVRIVSAEGRSFLAADDRKYDLIWLVAPDSYAAMNAASASGFVLSESYLYTGEMIREALARLEPGGVLCAQFGEFDFDGRPLRTTRYLVTARAVLEALGAREFERHVLVGTAADYPMTLSTVLLSNEPFLDSRIHRFLKEMSVVDGGAVRHPAPEGEANRLSALVITAPAAVLAQWLEAWPQDLSSVWDDSPFFWHFSRFRDVFASFFDQGLILYQVDSVGEGIILVLFLLSVGFACIALLLPFVFVRPLWASLPKKLPATLYFASLGLGFMLIEVSLIQMLTLFVGYPTYSLSVTLFSILVFSGVGSLLSSRHRGRRNRTLQVLGALLIILVGFYEFGLPRVLGALMGQGLALRLLLTVLLTAPLGMCLGTFMPIGLETIAALTEHRREYIAWAWAVNGFFSVISSVLATLLAMSFGFKLVLALALAAYLIGVAALLRVPAPVARDGAPELANP